MNFKRNHFIGLKDKTGDEILQVLEIADTMKFLLAKENKKSPHLAGKNVVMLFYEKSSRSRLSFELAAQYLGANIVDLLTTLELTDNESLIDMGGVIDQMGGDYIIFKHPCSGSAKLLAENTRAGVISAGDGVNENPSQSLIELLTIKKEKGGFGGLKVTIVGDVAHSRVAKSNIWGLLTLGAEVRVAAPPTLVPAGIEGYGVSVMYDVAEAVNGADVILCVRLKSEVQLENSMMPLNEYKNFFLIDAKTLRYAKKDAIVMHPGPINKGVEISSEVISGRQCLVDDQIANGIAVRMAMLYILSLKGDTSGWI